ncbi:MAG TPA: inorganic phosphate transporter [Candidatus Cloacimonadota bacterium]|nr:inorganic phosphate transporter [Candidatus Cloacimonadota bacterium]HPT72731.1 inorganic phosphate transporter [Candidatus Cloacimonadota bacterium]
MLSSDLLLLLIITIALLFDVTNGIHDSANAIATVISTKVLSPPVAVLMAAVLNFAGAFIGTKVAHTIGGGIVNPDLVTGCQSIILAALLGAISWNLFTWRLGLPSSSSHALIGGLIGATINYRGWGVLHWHNIIDKIIIPLFASPIAGFIGGYLLMLLITAIFKNANPRKSSKTFRRLQILSSGFMATSHGMNDAQKTMGIITLALYSFNHLSVMTIPTWVKLASATAMFIGTATGGWRIIKTMGHGIFRMEPIHGFAAETASATVITTASYFGAPISTTHAITSSVMGVGASKRFSAVRWDTVNKIVFAWIVTIPAAALTTAFLFEIIRWLHLVK